MFCFCDYFQKMFQTLRRALHQIQRQPCADVRRQLQKIGLLGVPFSRGQKKFGVECGPKAIREGGLLQEITDISGNCNYSLTKFSKLYAHVIPSWFCHDSINTNSLINIPQSHQMIETQRNQGNDREFKYSFSQIGLGFFFCVWRVFVSYHKIPLNFFSLKFNVIEDHFAGDVNKLWRKHFLLYDGIY